jgi:enediyne biosynthesis protein CalE5
MNARSSSGTEDNSGGRSGSRSAAEPDPAPAQSFDPQTYRVAQRQEWNDVAPFVARWWRIVYEAPLVPVTRRMIELAEIRPGHRVLDAATGLGEPALAAAAVVGPAGRVTASDVSSEMLRIAAERAAEAGLTNLDFVQQDAEAIDYPDSSFDAVFCRFALMFLADPLSAIERMRRGLRKGGRLVAAVWGPPERVPLISVTMGVITRELQLPPPPPGTPGVFALADRGALEELFWKAGFEEVQSEPLNLTFEFASTDEYIRYVQDVALPIWGLLANDSEARKEQVWRSVADAHRPFQGADGVVRLEGESLLVWGRR